MADAAFLFGTVHGLLPYYLANRVRLYRLHSKSGATLGGRTSPPLYLELVLEMMLRRCEKIAFVDLEAYYQAPNSTLNTTPQTPKVSRAKEKTCINILIPSSCILSSLSCLKPKSIQQTIRIRLVKLRRRWFLLLFLLLLFLLRIRLLLKRRRLALPLLELSDW